MLDTPVKPEPVDTTLWATFCMGAAWRDTLWDTDLINRDRYYIEAEKLVDMFRLIDDFAFFATDAKHVSQITLATPYNG